MMEETDYNPNVYSTSPTKHDVSQKRESVLKLLQHTHKTDPLMTLTANSIAKILGFKQIATQPDVRQAIAELRDLGEPIISSNGGFKLTNSTYELTNCIEQLQNRIDGILRSQNGLRKAIDRIQGKESPQVNMRDYQLK